MSSDHEHLDSRIDDGIRRVRIERPARRNAITLEMFAALASILRAADADDATHAVLLSGAGDVFTAGHDLDAFAGWPQGDGDPVPAFLHALAGLGKPLVVAVHGAAVGVGATMLLHADWVCCAPDTRLRFPFVDLGIGPEAASSALLARAVGLPRARRLLLGGEAFSGQQAFDWGLVAELADAGRVLDTAAERAAALAAKPAHAFAGTKRLLATEPPGIGQRIDEEIAFINRSLAQRTATD